MYKTSYLKIEINIQKTSNVARFFRWSNSLITISGKQIFKFPNIFKDKLKPIVLDIFSKFLGVLFIQKTEKPQSVSVTKTQRRINTLF